MIKPRKTGSAVRIVLAGVLRLAVTTAVVHAGYPQVGGTGALEFDGDNDYVTLGNRASLRLSGDLSVGAWVKLGSGTSGALLGIAGKYNLNQDGFCLTRRSTNTFGFQAGVPGMVYTCKGTRVVTDSEWHHVAGVIRSGTPYLYVDGQQDWVDPSWTHVQVVDSGQDAFVGRWHNNDPTGFFEGSIDEVYFYDRALSATEIQKALSTRPATTDAALAGYWSFDEATGQVVSDGSGKGNHGYLGSSSVTDGSDPRRVSNGGTPPPGCTNNWSHLLTFDNASDMAYVATNNSEHNYGGPLPVERITGQQPDSAGMLRMQNLVDVAARSATRGYVIPARATFTFHDSLCWPFSKLFHGQVSIRVSFDYLFRSQDTVLRVRISNGLADDYADSAIAPEPWAQGGANSMTWATHSTSVWLPYDLLKPGTTGVTLELKGPDGARVLLNNLNISAELPFGLVAYILTGESRIRCRSHCADIAGVHDDIVGPEDFLAGMRMCGSSVPTQAPCVDAEFTRDDVVSVEDAEYFGWAYTCPQICSCGAGAGVFVAAAALLEEPLEIFAGSPDAPLVIAGKVYQYDPIKAKRSFLSDGLFGLDLGFNPVGEASIQGGECVNTRLVKDHYGRLYQLNVTRGLVRLSDDTPILPCGPLYNSTWTMKAYVGWTPGGQAPPIQDAAFDNLGYLYVVPVVVSSGTQSYRAAAKIFLGTFPADNRLVQLYDAERLYSTGVHEIEVDNSRTVYVLDKRSRSDSRLLRYPANAGVPSAAGLQTATPIRPDAFLVSKKDGKIFIAGQNVSGGSTLVFVDPLHYTKIKDVQIPNLGYVTAITEELDTGTLWVVGFSVQQKWTNADVYRGATKSDQPEYRPFLAQVPRGASSVDARCLTEYADDGKGYLSLPLSIVRTGDDF